MQLSFWCLFRELFVNVIIVLLVIHYPPPPHHPPKKQKQKQKVEFQVINTIPNRKRKKLISKKPKNIECVITYQVST